MITFYRNPDKAPRYVLWLELTGRHQEDLYAQTIPVHSENLLELIKSRVSSNGSNFLGLELATCSAHVIQAIQYLVRKGYFTDPPIIRYEGEEATLDMQLDIEGRFVLPWPDQTLDFGFFCLYQ